MIRMKRSKPRASGTRMRTRRVTMRFTDNPDATGLFLKPTEVVDCDCSEGILQSLPEWEYVYDKNGKKINCNFPNVGWTGSFKVNRGDNAFEDDYYLLTTAGSFLHYTTEHAGFYSTVVNRDKVTAFFVESEYEPKIAICTEKGFMLGDLRGKYVVGIDESENTLAAGALYKHRIFVAMRGAVVRYSAPENFTNFEESSDEGGLIAFPHCGGEIVCMKVYEDALYIFFKSGIMRLAAGGEPGGFYAERIDYTGGDIFSRTVCVCAHAVYFLARNGLYRLKGKRVERLDLKADFPTEETGLESCAVWKDQPMIRYQKSNGEYETIVVKQNGKSAFFMSGLNALGYGENGKVFFIDRLKYLCQQMDKGTDWREGRINIQATDFGWAGKKRLETLRLYGAGEITLAISWNDMTEIKTLNFSQGMAEWNIDCMEYGECYSMVILLGRASKVSSIQVEYKTFV